MIRRPPRSTRTDTLLPDTTLVRAAWLVRQAVHLRGIAADAVPDSLSGGLWAGRDEGDRNERRLRADLPRLCRPDGAVLHAGAQPAPCPRGTHPRRLAAGGLPSLLDAQGRDTQRLRALRRPRPAPQAALLVRSEEHTSELQSLMR